MSTKKKSRTDFGIDGLLRDTSKLIREDASQEASRPSPQHVQKRETRDDPPPLDKQSEEARFTVVMSRDMYDRLKALAFWERRAIRGLTMEAFLHYFESRGEEYVENALREHRRSGSDSSGSDFL